MMVFKTQLLESKCNDLRSKRSDLNQNATTSNQNATSTNVTLKYSTCLSLFSKRNVLLIQGIVLFANVKTASTPTETQKPLVKDEEASDVDVHLYRSMIGSLMYLTASRPDIMFAICACSRFQVTSKSSYLSAVKRIFSEYAGANLDRKSITGGCQFLGRRLISRQCKKQTIMATSTIEAEYVVAANCCGQ
ncbi:hypothetical protein Tco_1421434, partial [Tanacetum coccineum]